MTTAPNTTGHKPTRDLGKPSITPGMSRTCHTFHSYLQVEAPIGCHVPILQHCSTLSRPPSAAPNFLSASCRGSRTSVERDFALTSGPSRDDAFSLAQADGADEPISRGQDGGSALRQLRPQLPVPVLPTSI
jgi:hypothetical protein